MRIHRTINERTLRRSFSEKRIGRNGLTVIDRDLPAFGLKVSKNGRKTFFVRASRPVGRARTVLGTADRMTAAEAREKAVAVIAAAKAERETGPLFADFVTEFMRRQGRRWKPSTEKGNRHLIDRHLVPFFGTMPVAEIARATRSAGSIHERHTRQRQPALPVLSVMMKQAELWDFRPQGSNPCRNMRRYKTAPRERFLSVGELKRLASSLITPKTSRPPPRSGCCCSPARGRPRSPASGGTDTRCPRRAARLEDWAEDHPAPAVRAGGAERLAPKGALRIPQPQGRGPMTDLGLRWHKLRDIAGLEDVRIHDCRHTFASHAVMNGAISPPSAVSWAMPTSHPPSAMPISPTSTSVRRPGASPASSTRAMTGSGKGRRP